MRETRNSKPEPARSPEGDGAGGTAKPTPARELGRAEPRSAAIPAPTPARAPARDADVAEVALETGGACWKVRVRGRSGGTDTRSPPLLLLGFWAEQGNGEPDREATVVARALSELSIDRLEQALAASSPPPAAAGRKPFFEGVTQGRRGGS